MKKLCGVFLFFLFLQGICFGQPDSSFIAIWACDTNDAEIGDDVKRDAENLAENFKSITNHLQIDFNSQSFIGDDFSATNLMAAIEAAPVRKHKDIFFVVISDHCINRTHQFFDENLHSSTIISAVKSKKARLSIVIHDCCDTSLKKGDKGAQISSINLKQLERLFFDAEGFIEIYSCSEGQLSFSDEKGSFLIKNFFVAMNEYIITNEIAPNPWQLILNKAAELVYSDALELLQEQSVNFSGVEDLY